MAGTGAFARAGLRRLAATFVAAVTLALALLVAGAPPAAAHATLVRSAPADDAVLPAAPERFTLTFNEAVSPLMLRLIGPDGSSQTLDRFELKGSELSIAPPSGLGSGSHALSWRVISDDGHPVGGTTVFSIGAPSGVAFMAADDAPDGALRAAIWTTRLVLYVGLLFGVGGAVALSWLATGRSGAQAFALFAMLAGAVAAPLSIGLQGVDALGASLTALPRGVVWTTGFGTSYGRTALIAGGAFALGMASLALTNAPARSVSLLALLGVGLALAASGHASAADPQWLTRPAVFLHAAGVAFWLGALVPLGFALRSTTPEAEATLRRFSRTAPFALAAIVVAGVALAAVQLGSVDALWMTAYGAVLLTKLALLAPLFGLAALNRWRLAGPAADGSSGARRRLRRSIAVEIALAAAILGVVAAWRFTPPPRALAAAAAEPASVHIHSAKAMADVTLAPGRVGRTNASIVIMTGDFGPLDAKEVTFVASNPAAGVEPIRRSAAKPGDGTWRVDELTLPVPGRWTVRLDILVSDFELVKLEGEIDVRR